MKKSYEVHMNREEGKKKRHGTIIYPDTIGPYTFKKTIGEGAFSIVKLVYHELFFQYYACKIVPINMLKKRNLYDRFELEIRISQIMRYPGVAAVTDVLKDDNNFYVFMEYYPNGNLLNYIISKRRLKEKEAKGIMYQIFDALKYIHGQGICHRDLKPENIIIDNNGHIRISDFGLSQFVDRDNLVATACGSPCYVSPEVVSGEKYNGFLADCWSCGVILYAMMTGFLPWTKKDIKEIFYQIRNGEYKIPWYVPDQCKNLISMLLTVDTSKRIQLNEAMNHTWFGIKSEEGKKELLNFTIPLKYLKKSSELVNNANYIHQVPYLSTRKVDIYFRPDIDYDFDNKFDNISNIHAINNSINAKRCDVSSPYLNYDEAIKILTGSNNNAFRFRKRKYSTNKINNNLDLNSNSNIKMRSLSTGKLIISYKHTIKNFVDSKLLPKEKSEIYFIVNKPNKQNKNKISPNKKSEFSEKHRRKSAAIPKW